MSITDTLASLSPEVMREKFHELGREAEKREAAIAETREAYTEGREKIDEIRKALEPLRKKIKAHNAEMGPIMRARTILTRALKGRTGRPE